MFYLVLFRKSDRVEFFIQSFKYKIFGYDNIPFIKRLARTFVFSIGSPTFFICRFEPIPNVLKKKHFAWALLTSFQFHRILKRSHFKYHQLFNANVSENSTLITFILVSTSRCLENCYSFSESNLFLITFLQLSWILWNTAALFTNNLKSKNTRKSCTCQYNLRSILVGRFFSENSRGFL